MSSPSESLSRSSRISVDAELSATSAPAAQIVSGTWVRHGLMRWVTLTAHDELGEGCDFMGGDPVFIKLDSQSRASGCVKFPVFVDL